MGKNSLSRLIGFFPAELGDLGGFTGHIDASLKAKQTIAIFVFCILCLLSA